MKSTKQPKMEWYYSFEGVEFNYFECAPEGYLESHMLYGLEGPFKTFEDAKQDAKERFECDKIMALESLAAIRNTSKRKILSEAKANECDDCHNPRMPNRSICQPCFVYRKTS